MSAETKFSFASTVLRQVPLETITVASFVEAIRSGRWAEPVERVRSMLARDDKDAAEKAKRGLPAVLPSGVFDERSNEGLRERTGLICADLDALGDQLPSYREHIEADEYTLACFLSPSGTGLKVLLRLDLDRSHEDGFRAMRRHFLERFGLPVDEACKDVSRACFVSYDPEAFLAHDAQVLPLGYMMLSKRAECLVPADDDDVRDRSCDLRVLP